MSIRIEALKGKSRNAAELAPGAKYTNILADTKKIKEAPIRFRVENCSHPGAAAEWKCTDGTLANGISLKLL